MSQEVQMIMPVKLKLIIKFSETEKESKFNYSLGAQYHRMMEHFVMKIFYHH